MRFAFLFKIYDLKSFIQNIVLFFSSVVIVFLTILVLALVLSNREIKIDVPRSTKTVFLGDSHIECAINDSLIKNSINIAQSGNSYLFSYLKLKSTIEQNDNISSVILGFSDFSMFRNWFNNEKSYRLVHNYMPILGSREWYCLFINNPVAFIESITLGALKSIYRNILNQPAPIGKYLALNNTLNESLRETIPQTSIKKKEISTLEKEYLLKIYDYCISKNIKLILINTPVTGEYKKRVGKLSSTNCTFLNDEMPSAIFINHSDYNLPRSHYADNEHLNKSGATLYSTYLSSIKLSDRIHSCDSF